MKLEWMGEYRDVVEALIHYCNIYAAAYRIEKMEYRGVRYSYSQIQVLEYLLESEDKTENMSHIAARLGITRSNFSKIANRLVAKGLLEKSPMPGSHKEMKLTVNSFGRELYDAYSQEILRWHFSPMFKQLDRIDKSNYPAIRDALYGAMRDSTYLADAEGAAAGARRAAKAGQKKQEG